MLGYAIPSKNQGTTKSKASANIPFEGAWPDQISQAEAITHSVTSKKLKMKASDNIPFEGGWRWVLSYRPYISLLNRQSNYK